MGLSNLGIDNATFWNKPKDQDPNNPNSDTDKSSEDLLKNVKDLLFYFY